MDVYSNLMAFKKDERKEWQIKKCLIYMIRNEKITTILGIGVQREEIRGSLYKWK